VTPLEALLAPATSALMALGSADTCPPGMRLVTGEHPEQVQRLCVDYRQGHCFSFWPGFVALEPRSTPIRTCMDEFEWPNQRGVVPTVMVSFTEAEQSCASVGKRLCTEFEWESACEGPDVYPYPYGFATDAHRCNTDRPYRPVDEAKLASNSPTDREREARRLWQGEPSGARDGCVSHFGIHDLVGNVEEWVRTSRPEWPWPSSLKGSYWSKPWASCRGTNERHGPRFRFYEIGFRCCADPE